MSYIGNNPKVRSITCDGFATLADANASTKRQGRLVFIQASNKYFIDDGVALTEIAAPSDLDVYYAETFEGFDLANIVSGNDPAFLNGGTLDGAVSLEESSALTLSGTQSLRYTQGASSLNDYFVVDTIDLDKKQRNLLSGISFSYTSNVSTASYRVVLYDVTNGQVLSPANFELEGTQTGTSNLPKRFEGKFTVPRDCEELAVGVQVINANASTLVLDDISLSINPLIAAIPSYNENVFSAEIDSSGTQ